MKEWNNKKTFVETYEEGKIKICRNFNKRGGKFFYVIFKKIEETMPSEWLGKIMFDPEINNWKIEFEGEKELCAVDNEERIYITKILKEIKGDYKDEL